MDKRTRPTRRRRIWTALLMMLGGIAAFGLGATVLVAYEASRRLVATVIAGMVAAASAIATLMAVVVGMLAAMALLLVLSTPPWLTPFTPAGQFLGWLARTTLGR